jgi:hypothetical protein
MVARDYKQTSLVNLENGNTIKVPAAGEVPGYSYRLVPMKDAISSVASKYAK